MSERNRSRLLSFSSFHGGRRTATLSVLALAASLSACGGSDGGSVNNNAGATATLAVLETTDLHFNVRSYDYFKLAEDKSYGFERTATLVRAARKEFANTLLVDNGDTIQGTALADYEATINPIACTQQLS
ncbi:MAG: bifunctional metallophosphatase/5'-nucleotidase, partial [Comamonadaceae bacterium]